jgi:iron-regulated transporter 1
MGEDQTHTESTLLEGSGDGYGSVPDAEMLGSSLKADVKRGLYISHFLYVWNARVYEFGIVLFIINLYPKNLLPPSLFSLVSTGSGVFLTNALTKLVNNGERLPIIKSTIFIQRFFAIFSSVTLLFTFRYFKHHETFKNSAFLIVILCGVVEKLSTIANKISISRDWIVKIAGKDQDFLVELNTTLRSIDLFCKLIGPFFISSFLTLTNHEITAIFFILSFLISSQVEFSAILRIYDSIPILRKEPELQTISNDGVVKLTNDASYWKLIKLFFQTPLSLWIISVSMTYFTVLSFGNSTVAYLLSFDDITNFSIGALKGISTVFELFGTMVIFPFLTKRVGLMNTGVISITFEFLALVPVAVGFLLGYDKTRWLMCAFIPVSRIGLWCFDLALQNSIQIFIEDDFARFNATSFEETFNNLFELLGFASTLIFNRPEQFEYPALATVAVIGAGALLNYFWYFRTRFKKNIIE